MPITKYSPKKLKKTKKDDLIIHILDLYSFIDDKSHQLDIENEKMIPVYEYADDLWREDTDDNPLTLDCARQPRPKICLGEPHEILSMMKSLKEEIEKLKEELYIYKVKPQLGRSYANSLRENKELQEEIQNLKDQNKEDLDDYQLFLDAFDVPHASEAIDNHWNYLSDESKESLIKNGYQVKSSK